MEGWQGHQLEMQEEGAFGEALQASDGLDDVADLLIGLAVDVSFFDG